MPWKIDMLPAAVKQLKKLDNSIKSRLIDFIDNRLSKLENFRQIGEALIGNHKGIWRYRIDDYRILCDIQDNVLTILVVEFGHKKKIYK